MGARRRGRLLAFCAGALAPRLARTSVAETTVFDEEPLLPPFPNPSHPAS